VLFIIGITLSFAVLSVGDRTRERSVETEAQRLAARVTLAAQEAVLQAKELALQTTAQGYQFLVLEYTNAGKQAEWRVLNDDEILRPRRLPPGMHLALTPQDGAGTAQTGANAAQKSADAARVYLLSSGEMTPFEASLSDDDAHYLISGAPNGKIAVRNSVHDDETT
jgi:general secretion pathway protein H